MFDSRVSNNFFGKALQTKNMELLYTHVTCSFSRRAVAHGRGVHVPRTWRRPVFLAVPSIEGSLVPPQTEEQGVPLAQPFHHVHHMALDAYPFQVPQKTLIRETPHHPPRVELCTGNLLCKVVEHVVFRPDFK